jgi:hypothetical protein
MGGRGLAAQLLIDAYSGSKLKFEVGIGPYLAYDSDQPRTGALGCAGVRAIYRLSRNTNVGLMLSRIISNDDRDEDMWLVGAHRQL